MNKKKILIVVIIIAIFLVFFYGLDRMKYTSLNEKGLGQITKNDDVRINIHRESDGASAYIRDKEMAGKIVDALSVVELKKTIFHGQVVTIKYEYIRMD